MTLQFFSQTTSVTWIGVYLTVGRTCKRCQSGKLPWEPLATVRRCLHRQQWRPAGNCQQASRRCAPRRDTCTEKTSSCRSKSTCSHTKKDRWAANRIQASKTGAQRMRFDTEPSCDRSRRVDISLQMSAPRLIAVLVRATSKRLWPEGHRRSSQTPLLQLHTAIICYNTDRPSCVETSKKLQKMRLTTNKDYANQKTTQLILLCWLKTYLFVLTHY